MNITKEVACKKIDMSIYMILSHLSTTIYFHGAIFLIVIISILEGVYFGFTTTHNLIYFFAICDLISIILALISLFIGGFRQNKKQILNQRPFTISLDETGYIAKCGIVKLDRKWTEDVFVITMLKNCVGFMTLNQPLVILPTKIFTREELVEIDNFFSSSTTLKKKYRKSKLFKL